MMRLLSALVLTAAGATGLVAQTPTPARTDSQPAPIPRALASVPVRAAWLSDRLPLRVGDILTIVIDEQAAANERVSTVATGDRAQRARLGIGVDSAVRLGPSKDFSTSLNSSSRDVGESAREGNLFAILTVRVMGLDSTGLAQIEGGKTVTIDGRTQNVRLKGIVRAEDVSPNNLVSSSRVADAVITYKGKKIGPRTGILGKILSILWP
jgi:flagellar L-ring protein precursor FlgH